MPFLQPQGPPEYNVLTTMPLFPVCAIPYGLARVLPSQHAVLHAVHAPAATTLCVLPRKPRSRPALAAALRGTLQRLRLRLLLPLVAAVLLFAVGNTGRIRKKKRMSGRFKPYRKPCPQLTPTRLHTCLTAASKLFWRASSASAWLDKAAA